MYYTVRVIPRAKKNKVVEENGQLKVHLTAPPVEGRANEALIEVLAEHFKVKKRQVRLVRGQKSRAKIVEIE
ncbi:MAG: YggU family protein [Candidatus Saganbacteria bacterium]|nr:YggU family protein [Candidatus Saganbacteria bacterium]